MISGFRRGVNEVFALLGCYAASIGSYWPTFRDNLEREKQFVKAQMGEDLTVAVDYDYTLITNLMHW